MARNFYEDGFLPFDPQVDWGGRHGYLEAESPLIPALIAVAYKIVGLHEIVGRIIIIAFSLGLVWATYRLALVLDGRHAVARAAAFLIAVSPASIFFGRIVIPDTPMVLFTVLALVGFAEFSRSGSVRWMTIGASALTFACLLKLPAVFVGPAIVALLVQRRGWTVFRDPRVWIAGVLPLAITAAWYWRAHIIFERTGLTMKILMIAPEPFFEPRGTPFSEYHRIRALTELGHSVDLVTYPFGRDVSLPGLRLFRSLRPPFVREIGIGPSWKKVPLDFLVACTALRRAFSERYDAVHSHEEGSWFGVLIAAMLGVPHLYDMHSSLPQQLVNFSFSESRLLASTFAWLERFVVRRSTVVVVICPHLADVVREIEPGVPAVLIENAPGSGDAPVAGSGDRIRRELGLSSDSPMHLLLRPADPHLPGHGPRRHPGCRRGGRRRHRLPGGATPFPTRLDRRAKS